MPSTAVSYPGVYIREIPSGVHAIVGVATSITAFVGRAASGPVDEARDVFSINEFQRTFGAVHPDYPMSFAVRDFFTNGGTHALIVRLFKPLDPPSRKKVTASVPLALDASNNLVVRAKSP